VAVDLHAFIIGRRPALIKPDGFVKIITISTTNRASIIRLSIDRRIKRPHTVFFPPSSVNFHPRVMQRRAQVLHGPLGVEPGRKSGVKQPARYPAR
jgi:hypothetical protein